MFFTYVNMRYQSTLYTITCLAFLACDGPTMSYQLPQEDTTAAAVRSLPVTQPGSAGRDTGIQTGIQTGKTTPAQLIAFARTLTGVPYLAGSANPTNGFDCSGFITYVFNHFAIEVPRSSVDFTHVNREVSLSEAKAGDLILFTGTDSTIRVVGHMGIVVTPQGAPVVFIHSTSGKAWGVTETPLNPYYMGRFEKIVRVFPQNDAR